MQAILSYVIGLGPWNWFILAVVLFGLETVIPGVHFLWFGVAAAIAGSLALATGLEWQWQLVIFALTAMATVFWLRRVVKGDQLASDEPALNERGHQYIGRIVTVEDAISGRRGRVRVGDTLWSAEGPDVPAGTRVRITATSGTILKVEPAEPA
jgi:membrane protein implicated in regulation of membrane protease activity